MSTLALEPRTLAQVRAAGVEDWLALHWEEVDPFQAESPLAIDWRGYDALERSGVLKIFCLYDGPEWIGYADFFVRPPLHHRHTLWAIGDLLYVDPAHRKGLAGAYLVRESERLLKAMGVRIIYHAPRARRDPADLGYKRGRDTVGALLGKLGYERTHEAWMKAI